MRDSRDARAAGAADEGGGLAMWRSVDGRDALRACARARHGRFAAPTPWFAAPRRVRRLGYLLGYLLVRSLGCSRARSLVGWFAGWLRAFAPSVCVRLRRGARRLVAIVVLRGVASLLRHVQLPPTGPTRPAVLTRALCRGGACFPGTTWGRLRSSGDVASAPCSKARTQLVIFFSFFCLFTLDL